METTTQKQIAEKQITEVKSHFAWGQPQQPETPCGTECSASSGDGCHGDGSCGGDGE